MAGELKFTDGIQYQNPATGTGASILKDQAAQETFAVNQAVAGLHGTVITVGITEEPANFGDIVTLGFVWLKNLDPINYVDYGPENAGAMVAIGRIKAGDAPHRLRLVPGIVLRLKANTAPCKVQLKAYND